MSYHLNDRNDTIHVKYGLQHITLPLGTWHIKTKPSLVEYDYFPDGDRKASTSHYTDKDGKPFSVYLDYGFGVSYFPNHVYFHQSDESYLYRLCNETILSPTTDEKLLEGYRKVEIFRSELTYCKGSEDEFILVMDGKLRTVWKFSGDEDYPLGQLQWAEFSSPWSAQYLGNSKCAEAEPCLIWSYNIATARN